MHSMTISGNSGFRMMSSPVSGIILADLLDELWLQGMVGSDATSGNSNLWVLDLAGQTWSQVNTLQLNHYQPDKDFYICFRGY